MVATSCDDFKDIVHKWVDPPDAYGTYVANSDDDASEVADPEVAVAVTETDSEAE